MECYTDFRVPTQLQLNERPTLAEFLSYTFRLLVVAVSANTLAVLWESIFLAKQHGQLNFRKNDDAFIIFTNSPGAVYRTRFIRSCGEAWVPILEPNLTTTSSYLRILLKMWECLGERGIHSHLHLIGESLPRDAPKQLF